MRLPRCSRSPGTEGARAGLAGLRARRRRRKQSRTNQSLQGQCCDRLRPSFLRRRLEQTLPLHTAPAAALVDWRWDSVYQRVNGVLLQNNQLRLRGVILRIDPLV
jgi:hypothetical protein